MTWSLWHWTAGRVTFTTRTSIPDAGGNAYLAVTFSAGTWLIRAQAAPTAMNANSTWTPDQRFVVR